MYAGIDVEAKGLFTGPHGRQIAGRFAHVATQPFAYGTRTQRDEWNALVATLEQVLRLHRHQPGALLRHAEYLYQRTGGMIGSLSHLIREAAIEANLDGSERITKPRWKLSRWIRGRTPAARHQDVDGEEAATVVGGGVTEPWHQPAWRFQRFPATAHVLPACALGLAYRGLTSRVTLRVPAWRRVCTRHGRWIVDDGHQVDVRALPEVLAAAWRHQRLTRLRGRAEVDSLFREIREVVVGSARMADDPQSQRWQEREQRLCSDIQPRTRRAIVRYPETVTCIGLLLSRYWGQASRRRPPSEDAGMSLLAQQLHLGRTRSGSTAQRRLRARTS